MKVEILIYEACLGSEVFAFADLLHMANSLVAAGRADLPPVFEVALVSSDGGERLLAGNVLSMKTTQASDCDLLVVPGMSFNDREALVARSMSMEAEHRLIQRHWKSRKSVASICVGAFLLAAAGVTKECTVTTGWPVASLLHLIDKSLVLNTDALVVTDGLIKTSGAVTAAFDLALDIISDHAGQDLVSRLRRLILLEPHRLGQHAFSRIGLELDAELTPIHRAKNYLRKNLMHPFSLAEVAKEAGLSVRSLQRNFKNQAGITVLSFHQQLRVDAGKHLLESTKLTVTQIALKVGFRDEVAFRKLFRSIAGMTPGEFRQRFALLKT